MTTFTGGPLCALVSAPKLLCALSVRHRLARCMVRHEVICKSALTQSTSLLPFLLVHHSSENSGLCTRLPYTAGRPNCRHCRSSKLPYTAGHPNCRTLQVVQTAVHCRFIQTAVHCTSSKLPYTAGHPNCRTVQVIQTAVHCRSSILPYSPGHPNCRTVQVIQTAVHCRSSKLPYSPGHPNCRTLQVVHTAVHYRSSKLPTSFLATGVSSGHS